jgi:hypothetical protein
VYGSTGLERRCESFDLAMESSCDWENRETDVGASRMYKNRRSKAEGLAVRDSGVTVGLLVCGSTHHGKPQGTCASPNDRASTNSMRILAS